MIVVDSCGWLEFFGGTQRRMLFRPAILGPTPPLVPAVCVYEVFRRLLPKIGKIEALSCVATMTRNRIVPLDERVALEAARLAMEYKLAFADASIYAVCLINRAELWTQDAHFKDLPNVRYFPLD
ncbi:MAG: VapC toxin family PIN domain ribonuclease [Spirochaetae bacterium HGW-Spirochaetae-7]|jgi:predicted nucleic acid-binding protein|nr:MAG: VapC toxin family PIN domain ribonuclease [Spirochaetae bacterium HGW-Spirochaetae-7]